MGSMIALVGEKACKSIAVKDHSTLGKGRKLPENTYQESRGPPGKQACAGICRFAGMGNRQAVAPEVAKSYT